MILNKTLVRSISLMMAATLLATGQLAAQDGTVSQANELATLRAAVAAQQKQLESLQQMLEKQQTLLDKFLNAAAEQPQRATLGTVASLTPMIPMAPAAAVAIPAPAQGAAPATPNTNTAAIDALKKTVDGIAKNLGGFKFSGDFRFRIDEQLRHGNNIAGPIQNSRARYRIRLNIDKEIIPNLTAHAQLSTGPFTNMQTNDQDFAGIGIKAPFSLAEAWIKYTKGSFTVRGGRMEEVFADNQRFVFDDDIRLNGFEARYNKALNKNVTFEARVGEYILTNPNTPIVGAGSPYLLIGYSVGQKVRDASIFHPGAILKAKSGKWVNQVYGDTMFVHNADQIQLASINSNPNSTNVLTTGTQVLAGNAVGIILSGAIGQTGNAVLTSGGAMLAARKWQIVKGGFRTDFADAKIGKVSMPFWADFQALGNAGANSDNKAFMASVNLGQVRKSGDMRFLYQYSWKQANSMIAQFTDDDLGTQSGVNTRVNSIRFDLGLTKFLQWQNILFIQDPIAANRPGFFVPVQKGANTTYRFLGHLAFTF